MRNYIMPGRMLPFVATAALLAGDVVVIGARIGIAAKNAAIGETVELAVDDVFSLPKATGAIAIGALVYWDAAAKKITTTASGNTLAGYAASAAASGDAFVNVKINA